MLHNVAIIKKFMPIGKSFPLNHSTGFPLLLLPKLDSSPKTIHCSQLKGAKNRYFLAILIPHVGTESPDISSKCGIEMLRSFLAAFKMQFSIMFKKSSPFQKASQRGIFVLSRPVLI